MVEKGVFIELDYTGRVNGKVFDTTIKEVADKAGLKRGEPKPVLIQVGMGELIKGVDETLLKMKEGEEKTVKVPPEKGYGERRPELVRVVPMKAFKQSNIKPVPGMLLTLDNMPARIQSVNGGRVRVDFNHELAGKELEFNLKVKRILKKPEEVLKVMGEKFLPEAQVSFKDGICELHVENPKKDYEQKKVLFVNRAMKVKDVKEVKVVETYKEPTIEITQ
ncbi:MAG: peptidylprolyl isomerase [Candidatus Diapherotrites archaeon]|nr:peptidylprolyl isomerase [Candidatus Diapherotrites archaeon]